MKRRVIIFVVFMASVTATGSAADVARDVIADGGIHRGLIVHVGCRDGRLTTAMRNSDACIVHGLDTDPANVQKAREHILAGKHGGAVSAAVFDGRHLPYVDNLVNRVVCSQQYDLTRDEILRVLCPGGAAVVRNELILKPRPDSHDQWTHYLHDADNNAVSRDTAVAAPLRRLQWKGSPKYSRHHDKSSSVPAVVSAGGRVFYIVDEGPRASILWDSDWQVVARDAFNGVILWKKQIGRWTDQLWPLKSGPSKTPRRLVAVNDAVYVTLGLLSPVSKLDAATGKELKVYAGTEKTEEIILKDGVLYLVIHPAIDPKQRGGSWAKSPKTVMAVREIDGTILWRHELPWIAPVTLTAGEKNVYVCDGPRIIAFDRKLGKEQWKSKELPWREKMPTYFAPTLVAAENCVLYVGGENWHEHAGSKGLMTCLDAATGKIKWQQPHLPSGYQSPQDIFVIGKSVWCGSLNSKPGEFDKRYPDVSPSTGEFISYNLDTGEPEKTIPRGANCYWFHHRCHRAKATENFFLTSRTGIEMIDISSGKWSLHHWARGACLYGIMPANGLVYCPPHPCACYPEAKLSGFNALAAKRGEGLGARNEGRKPKDQKRLEKGPAYEAIPNPKSPIPNPSDWPTFRGNAARSGSTAEAVGTDLKVKWQAKVGGRLSQPVAAGDAVFVAAVDDHALVALDRDSGKPRWTYIAGGRIDSPPTIYVGRISNPSREADGLETHPTTLCIFGSADGYVYCLRASDGALAWRFRAAPLDRRIMAWEQLESVWPVHGSVLIRDEVAYVIAGRSMFLDGGLTLYRLNPATGEVLAQIQMEGTDPNTGKDLHAHVTMLDMPVASSDILSSEGDRIFMRSQPFDLQGRRQRVQHVPSDQQRGEDAPLFVPNGFLDDNYWHRAFWVYGRSVRGGPGYGSTGHQAPSGKIMVLDDDNMYVFGRRQEYWRWTTATEYRLFSVDRSLPRHQQKPPSGTRRRGPKAAFATRWDVDIPVLVRAMVKAGDTLFACGPADIVHEPTAGMRQTDKLELLKKQAALFAGSGGSVLWAVSAEDGERLRETKLDVLPVFDGMIAAGGHLFLSTVDGKVVCLGSKR